MVVKIKLVITFLLLATVSLALRAPDLSIKDMSGGLNVSSSDLLILKNQSQKLQNVYLSEQAGALERRLGHSSVSDTIIGDNGLIGMYGSVTRSGRKRMYGILDPTTNTSTDVTKGLGQMFSTPNFSYQLDDAYDIYPYVFTGVSPSIEQWRNDVFWSFKGRQSPIVIHDDSARDMIVQVSGAPRLYTINRQVSSDYGLTGEYIYSYVIESNCGVTFGSELVTNGDFELSDPGDTQNWPDDWENNGDTAGANYGCDGTPHTGDSALTKDVDVNISQTIAVDNNSFYYISLYVDYRTEVGYLERFYTVESGSHDSIRIDIDGVDNIIGSDYVNIYIFGQPSGTIIESDVLQANTSTILVDDVSLKKKDDGQLYSESYLTQPIIALDSHAILHTNFSAYAMTSSCDTTDAEYDSLTLNIYRTPAYPEKIDELDTMYLVGRESYIRSDLDTLRWIDSIPDDSLGEGSFQTFGTPDFTKLGRASDTSITGFRAGAPTYIERDVASDPDFIDYPRLTGFAYYIVLEDTLTGYLSDTSRGLYIMADTTNPSDASVTIGLPPLPYGRNHLVRRIYKSFAFETALDTSAGNVVIKYDSTEIENPRLFGLLYDIFELPTFYRYKPVLRLDTNLTLPYHLATIRDSSAKSYKDSIAADTLLQRDVYINDFIPIKIDNLTLFQDRLIGSVGSFLLWSRLDSAGRWGAFSSLALNVDDGDDITAIVPYENHVKVFTYNSQFVAIPTGDIAIPLQQDKVVDGVGCIAPKSPATYLNNIFYLSDKGVISEQGLAQRENASSYGLISQNINSILLDHPDSILEEGVGVVVPRYNEYRLSFPSIDTTFVYNIKTGGWSINTYTFNQVSYYDTTKNASARPSSDLLFTKEGSDRIFIADNGPSDSSVIFSAVYQTPLIGEGYYDVMCEYLGMRTDASTIGNFLYYVLNQNDDTLFFDTVLVTAEEFDKYRILENPNHKDQYIKIEVNSSSSQTFTLKNIDFWLGNRGTIDIGE